MDSGERSGRDAVVGSGSDWGRKTSLAGTRGRADLTVVVGRCDIFGGKGSSSSREDLVSRISRATTEVVGVVLVKAGVLAGVC